MGISDLMNPKQIYDLVKKGAQLEAQEEIMKYRELLLEQSEEILDLKKENSSLKQKLESKGKIEKTDDGLFVLNQGNKEGPYCTRCYEITEKLISLRKIENTKRKYFHCSECKNSYGFIKKSPSSLPLGIR